MELIRFRRLLVRGVCRREGELTPSYISVTHKFLAFDPVADTAQYHQLHNYQLG